MTFDEFNKLCADNDIDYDIAEILNDSDTKFTMVCYVHLERECTESEED